MQHRMKTNMRWVRGAAFALASLVALVAFDSAAQDSAAIRKNLKEKLPQLGKVDEISKTPMAGLYEVRVGNDLFYSDDKGEFLIQNGTLIDVKGRKNLTEERQDKLLMIPFDQLPLKDAFTIVRGNGKRKIAIFEDPNCPYCREFERELQGVNDVTVYMFLYPMLGPDSTAKSYNLWCSKDRGEAWLDWMLREKPARNPICNISAVARNVEFGRKQKISGTPTIFFADGTRVAGAMPGAELEKLLVTKQ